MLLRTFGSSGAWSLACKGLVAAVAVFGAAVPTAQSYLDVPEPVIWVEEDWVLTLNEPDNGFDSPQFHTIMSPGHDLEGNYAQTLWNYREAPDYVGGGIQLQSYDDESLLRVRSVEQRSLSSTAETITWTQGLWTDGLTLSFYITNGLSSSWGAFGRDMRIDENAALSNLNGYSAEVSAANCCVTYGMNRVEMLMITEVRRYSALGLVSVDTTPRVVYEYDEDLADGVGQEQ